MKPQYGLNNRNTAKVDTQLNTTIRLITGATKLLQLDWLLVLNNSMPSHINWFNSFSYNLILKK